MTPQLKTIGLGRYGLQQSYIDDAGGEILEEVAYWRDVEQNFGRDMGQDLDEKLHYAGIIILSAHA